MGITTRYLIGLASIILLLGCARTTIKPRVLPPSNTGNERTEVKKLENKVDTVSWTILTEDEYPPIRSNRTEDINPFERSISTISMLIPFEVKSENDNLTRGESKFANFYAGALMGLEELDNNGFSVNIEVMDTRRSQPLMDNIIRSGKLNKTDVIVGPYEVENLKKICEWSKNKKVPVISPWRSSSNITSKNPYYYQVRPLIEQYFESMILDAIKDHDEKDIYIIGSGDNNDDAKVRAIQRIHEQMGNIPLKSPMSEYRISVDSLQDSEQLVFDSLFIKSPKAALIIPHYSSRDAQFVYSVIRKLSSELSSDQDISVYGMPTIVNAARMDLEFFRSLKLYSVDYKHIDKSSATYKKFIDKYYKKYNAVPTEDSYDGYDTMIMVYNMIEQAKLGVNYSEQTKMLPMLSYLAKFQKFSKETKLRNSSDHRYMPFDFMVNKSLGRIEFIDNRFVKTEINSSNN